MNNPYRNNFNYPEGIYLLNHAVGCLPKSVPPVVETYLTNWASQGANAWPIWLEQLDIFRQTVANFLNAKFNEICPQVNNSSSLSKILNALPKRKGRNRLLISEFDFPSIFFVVNQFVRLGYQIEVVKAEQGHIQSEQWQNYLNDDVQALICSHVAYSNSYQQPIKALAAQAKKWDIFCLIDVAQSAGVVPIDVRDWQVDVIFGSSVKWLCGGQGAGFLWVNEKVIDQLEPLDVGWFSHVNRSEFNPYNFEYAQDATRFWGGTPSILPYIIATESIKLLHQMDIANIREHNLKLTRQLIELAKAQKIKLNSPDQDYCRGGTVCLGFADSKKMCDSLRQQHIFTDLRPASGVRMSPHIYNTAEEIGKVSEILSTVSVGN